MFFLSPDDRNIWILLEHSLELIYIIANVFNSAHFDSVLGKLENPESGIPPEFLRVCFFDHSKRFKSSRRLSEVRIFSEDDPRATEVTRTSPTNNWTAESVPKIFWWICLYSEDYPRIGKQPENPQSKLPKITRILQKGESFACTTFFVISPVRSKHLSPK